MRDLESKPLATDVATAAAQWCSGKDVGTCDQELDSPPVHCQAAWVNSAFHLSRVLAYWLGLRRGVFTCVGWQVTLCDPMWQVTPHISVIRLISLRAICSFNLLTFNSIETLKDDSVPDLGQHAATMLL